MATYKRVEQFSLNLKGTEMSSYYLTQHLTENGSRWALNDHYLPKQFTLSFLMELPEEAIRGVLDSLPQGLPADDPQLAPVEHSQEVWAAGVTYLRSREARMNESEVAADVYERVYDAERPEIFMKAIGWRVVGNGMPFHIRKDSSWNVPEPELVLVLNHAGEIIGYSAGNDVSSRDIEGENPLYLPQAKMYNRSCVVGPGICLADVEELRGLPIQMQISRNGSVVFSDETNTDAMKRTFRELASCLYAEMNFPQGTFLMTGTCIVPPEEFTLQADDVVRIDVGDLTLVNETAQ